MLRRICIGVTVLAVISISLRLAGRHSGARAAAASGDGPAQLDHLLQLYDGTLDESLLPEIDAAAHQRDAVFSRLYWYTDLNSALAAAAREHKPILYLRLMGKLTDEYSCANSRFFRTVLYANHDVSSFLRQRYILVWESERPVPVVTINYGDGRVLKRTLTGNSVHYLLDSQGHVIDALPGLYGPQTFLKLVSAFAWQNSEVGSLPLRLANIEQEEYEMLRQWQSVTASANPKDGPQPLRAAPADAFAAMRRTATKSAVEMPLLQKIDPGWAASSGKMIDATDAAGWEKIGAAFLPDSRLDAASVSLIRSKSPRCADLAVMARTVDRFEHLIAVDTARNQFLLRRRILTWLRESHGDLSLSALNDRVYGELFLTPKTDAWLGLVESDAYCALKDDGVASAQ